MDTREERDIDWAGENDVRCHICHSWFEVTILKHKGSGEPIFSWHVCKNCMKIWILIAGFYLAKALYSGELML